MDYGSIFEALKTGAYLLAAFYTLTFVFNAAVKDPAKWEAMTESKWPAFKKLADFMRKSGVDPVATWRAGFDLLGHLLKIAAKMAGIVPVAVIAMGAAFATLTGCAALESIFTPSRIEHGAELAACVVPMLEEHKPIADILLVCGPDAEKFIAGYKAGLAKHAAR